MISRIVLALMLVVGLGAGLLAGGRVATPTPAGDLLRDTTILRSGQTVGQTFVVPAAGFDGITLLLAPDKPGDATITVRLRESPQATADLAITELAAREVQSPGRYSFSFAPQAGSLWHDYYVLLEYTGDGQVKLGKLPGASYLDGALYRNGEPRNAQTAFELHFDPLLRLWGWVQLLAIGFGALLAGVVLFVLPGLPLLRRVVPNLAERIVLAAGLSLALIPLLLAWTDIVGLHLGPVYAWLPPAVALIALALQWRRGRASQASHEVGSAQPLLAGFFDMQAWALVVVVGLLFASRLLMVAGLPAPMWGDSYQHTMIAQLILDQGGLFRDWSPYVPYSSLTVQFGFSADVALFAWLSGIGVLPATLIVGQLLNALAVLTIYPLAVRLADGNRWAGVLAVLVAGLLLPIPTMYLNWGRYAQLAGQVILPVALWFLWEALERDERPWLLVGLAGVCAAGMTLAYYRMPFYYLTFIPALLLGWGLPRYGLRLQFWLRSLLRLAVVGGIAGLLLVPSALRNLDSKLGSVVQAGVAQAQPMQRVLDDYQIWRSVTEYVPVPLLALALLGLVWSLVCRRWIVASLGLWVLLLAALVAGRLIRLPGANLMQSFAVLIALYIPIGLVCGWLLGLLANKLMRQRRSGTQALVTLALVAVAAWGAWQQQAIPDPARYALVTWPDLRALEWVRTNTNRDARFLVQSYRILEGRSAVGGDAGWWLALLGERQNTMPPQYALLNERASQPGYSKGVVDLVAALEETSIDSKQGVRLLCANGITHIYSGQRRELVGVATRPLFDPDDLADSGAFELVYRQDRVFIFALRQERCR